MPKNAGQEGQTGQEGEATLTVNTPNQSTTDVITGTQRPETYTLTVNGKEQVLDRDGLVKAAQRGMAADERFQEAAELAKASQRAIAFQADLEAAYRENDEDAFRRVSASLGAPQEEIEQIVATSPHFQGGDPEDPEEDVVEGYLQQDRNVEPDPVGYGDLAPELQNALARTEGAYIEKAVTDALDLDEEMRYNMKDLSDEGKGVVRDMVKREVQGRLRTRQERGETADFGDGTEYFKEAVPAVKRVLAALTPKRTHGAMSMGRSPDGGGDVHPRKKPEYVSTLDGEADWTQNVMEEMMWHQQNMEGAAP